MRRAALLLALTACQSGGEILQGLAKSPEGNGPEIVWDVEAVPVPEVPLPNDVATRPDLESPTGRRLNLSRAAPTTHEQRLRRLLDGLDGFSTYGPIWLSFDQRLDLAALTRAHNDLDPSNDAVYLINITPGSPHYGDATPLDIGGGRFPLGLERSDQFFGNDPRAGASNLLFESIDEDTNGDGILQPDEDTDDDGLLDEANVWGKLGGEFAGRNDRYRDLISFYDLATNTLLMRPILPLDQLSTYAVVLTNRLTGIDSGEPVRSPFPWVNHLQQTEALRPLVDDGLLHRQGLALEDVAFTWSFTTQSVTKDLEVVRQGLYGLGPMSHLADEYPVGLTHVSQVEDGTDNVFVIRAEHLVDAFENSGILGFLGQSEGESGPLAQSYRDNVDYMVFAELESPFFIDNDDQAFDMDWQTGRATYRRDTLYLMCVVPKASAAGAPPYSVVLYGHGTGSNRLEAFGYGGYYAGLGFATCSIDMVSHGLPDDPLIKGLAEAAMEPYGLSRAIDILFTGRAHDLNNDGTADPGGDFWTANTFHTRDVVRQSTVDHFQLVRVLSSFGTGTMPVDVDGDGDEEMLGDFNGDGVADFGGDRPMFMTGGSLGGIMSSVIGTLEPKIEAVAPVSGGAGLSDIAVRSVQRYALEAIWMPILGPLVIGELSHQGTAIDLTFDVLNVATEARRPFASVPDAAHPEAMQLGDLVVVEDLDAGTSDTVRVRQPADGIPGQVRLQLGGNVGDRVRVTLWREGAPEPYRTVDTFEKEVTFYGQTYAVGAPLLLLQEGYGYRRGSTSLRRLASLAQTVVDPADPANYVRFLHDPLDLPPEGKVPKNVLFIQTPGDMNVPISTGLALSRIAGFWKPMEADPRYGMSVDQLLVNRFVEEGLDGLGRFQSDPCHYTDQAILYDLDELSQGLDAEQGPHGSSIVRPPACATDPDVADCDTHCAAEPPLRITVQQPWGMSGMRLPYILPTGIHSIDLPDESRDFDYDRYEINQIGWFFATKGLELVDDVCLASPTPCEFFPGGQ